MIHIEANAIGGSPKMAPILIAIMLIDGEVCFLLPNFDLLYVVDSEELQCVEAIVVAKQILSAALGANVDLQWQNEVPECRVFPTAACIDELDPALLADCR